MKRLLTIYVTTAPSEAMGSQISGLTCDPCRELCPPMSNQGDRDKVHENRNLSGASVSGFDRTFLKSCLKNGVKVESTAEAQAWCTPHSEMSGQSSKQEHLVITQRHRARFLSPPICNPDGTSRYLFVLIRASTYIYGYISKI